MPVFEYQCQDCNTKYEILHKSILKSEKVICPKCSSGNSKKLLSSFSSPVNAGVDFTPNCSDCSCNAPSSPCAGGTCGLH